MFSLLIYSICAGWCEHFSVSKSFKSLGVSHLGAQESCSKQPLGLLGQKPQRLRSKAAGAATECPQEESLGAGYVNMQCPFMGGVHRCHQQSGERTKCCWIEQVTFMSDSGAQAILKDWQGEGALGSGAHRKNIQEAIWFQAGLKVNTSSFPMEFCFVLF